jgi:cytosine/creatinine deaminase
VTDLLIRNARVPSCLMVAAAAAEFTKLDIQLSAGKITALTPCNPSSPATAQIDLDGGIALPGFVDCHTHLDKGHIWPRQPNPDGTFMGALDTVGADREANWSARDVETRMDFALRTAYAHGTAAMRTHIDSIGKQIGISWPVFAAVRAKWQGRIALQAAPLFGIQMAVDPAHMRAVIDAVKAHGSGILGAVTYMCPELEDGLDILFRAAIEYGFDLDFHVDEASDPAARSLERIALAALRHRFTGQILCGHCCSLALQTPQDEARIIALVKEAGIAIVSLPLCNMYLQDRLAGRTPRWRGVSSLHELKAAGVPVMVASDNTRDPFYAYGDLDPLEVYREATRIAHFDHPVTDWPCTVTRTPADIMGLAAHGRIGIGLSADLVLTRARTWTELLSRPQSDRVVVRSGRVIERVLPDYRELDTLQGFQL